MNSKRTWVLMSVSLTTALLSTANSNSDAWASTPTEGAVYDSIPAAVPGNVPSQAFEATSTSEFGDLVRLGPGGRTLDSVRVIMSSWGCETGNWNLGDCVTTPGATFSHDLTLNIYAVDPTTGEPDTLLATKTQTFDIPYRPSADLVNCTGGPWFDGTNCYNGFATPVEWDFSGSPVILPSKVVWAVAYDTTHYGASPIGESAACYTESGGCGYDSLNVGAKTFDPDAYAGQDIDPDGAVLDSTWSGAYCVVGGTGTLRTDTAPGCWADYRPLAEIVTSGSTETIVVRPSATSGWGILPSGAVAVTSNNATGTIVAGPGGQSPLLPGSVEYQTKSVPGGKPQLYAPATIGGTKLSELTALVYQSFVSDYADGGAWLTHTLNVFIDRNGNGVNDGDWHTLVYEPCYTTSCALPVQPLNTWTTFDALTPGAIWWATSTIPGTDFVEFASYVPLDSLLDAYPDATIRGIIVQAGQNSGGTPWNNFVGNVDGVAIGVNGDEAVYDFEPDPVCDAEVLPPLQLGAENMVQKGQVVPVKIRVVCDGEAELDLTPAIQLFKGDKSGMPDSAPDSLVTESVSGADTTGVMRAVDSMYIYNLRVPSAMGSTALVKGDELTIRIKPFAPGNTTLKITDILLQIRK